MPNDNAVLNLLREGLNIHAKSQTLATLGDRQTYLGMSDLAFGISCPRAVLASKLSPEKPNLSLQNLLQLQRGHWLEAGVEQALKATGTLFLSQLEIGVERHGVPIKAHLDFTLIDLKSLEVTVLELKSLAKIKDAVYETHETQLSGQISLLNEYWNERVFKFDNQGPYSFPELAKRFSDLKLASKPSIQGYVLTVSPNEARAFGPYRPDSAKLANLLSQGANIWKSLNDIKNGQTSLDQSAFTEGFYPLCDYCRFNGDCPKFAGEDYPVMESELVKLMDLKSQKGVLEDEIQEREDQLKGISSLMGKTGQWITTGRFRFKVSMQKGRSSLDHNLLKSNLRNIAGLDESMIVSVTDASQKTGRPFERLFLSPLN
jgi:hypothetical protein